MNYEENPCLVFATTIWYDWSGTLTEEKLISRLKSVQRLSEIFNSDEIDKMIGEGVGEAIKDPQYQLELWKSRLISEDKLVIVNHDEQIVLDYQNEDPIPLAEWRADILTRSIDDEYFSTDYSMDKHLDAEHFRNRLPSLIRKIEDHEQQFDKIKKDFKDDWLEATWKIYTKNRPLEEDWQPLIINIKDEA